MINVLEKERLRQLEHLLGKGIYEGYTLERMLREAPDFHYCLEEEGQPVACVSIWIHTDMVDEKGVSAGAIGHFEAVSKEAAKQVLEMACKKLKVEGDAYVIGPIDGSTWNSYRLVTYSDGSMPFLMEPRYKEGYSQWLKEAGFKDSYQYFSAKETIENLGQGSKLRESEEVIGHEKYSLTKEDNVTKENRSSDDIIIDKVNLEALEEDRKSVV